MDDFVLIDQYSFVTKAEIRPNMIYALSFTTVTELVQTMCTHPLPLVGGGCGMARMKIVFTDHDAETVDAVDGILDGYGKQGSRSTKHKKRCGGSLCGLHLCHVLDHYL